MSTLYKDLSFVGRWCKSSSELSKKIIRANHTTTTERRGAGARHWNVCEEIGSTGSWYEFQQPPNSWGELFTLQPHRTVRMSDGSPNRHIQEVIYTIVWSRNFLSNTISLSQIQHSMTEIFWNATPMPLAPPTCDGTLDTASFRPTTCSWGISLCHLPLQVFPLLLSVVSNAEAIPIFCCCYLFVACLFSVACFQSFERCSARQFHTKTVVLCNTPRL